MLFKALNLTLPQRTVPSSTNNISNQSVNEGASDFQFQPITYREVGALPHLRQRNSAGADNLNGSLLKPAASLRCKPVTDIFNLTLFSRDRPSIGKCARIIPS